MKQINLDTSFLSLEPEELDQEERLLLDQAWEACDMAYAPYSGFQVGVALLLDNGEIIQGANQENAAYPMCICAEPVALSRAKVQHPEAKIMWMAIRVKNTAKPALEPAAPCGACRQMISEYEGRQEAPIGLLLQGQEGPIYKFQEIAPLLPLSFSGKFL